ARRGASSRRWRASPGRACPVASESTSSTLGIRERRTDVTDAVDTTTGPETERLELAGAGLPSVPNLVSESIPVGRRIAALEQLTTFLALDDACGVPSGQQPTVHVGVGPVGRSEAGHLAPSGPSLHLPTVVG